MNLLSWAFQLLFPGLVDCLFSVRTEKVDKAVVVMKLHIRTFISTTNDDFSVLPFFVLLRRTICTNYGNKNPHQRLDCLHRGS